MPALTQKEKLNLRKISLELLSTLHRWLLDALFPVHCLNCHRGEQWICPTCLARISRVEQQVCPHCEKITTPNGILCSSCQDFYYRKNSKPPLDALILSARYPHKENGLAHYIHAYKYRFLWGLAEPLGQLMTEAFWKNSLSLPDFILPVPLHPRRLRWRGFNQAEKLAGYLGESLAPNLAIPVKTHWLKRVRYTPPQMSVRHYADRKNNLREAFVVEKIYWPEIKNRSILLVDDVATTGATLEECGKILKKAGAQKVSAIVLSRQEMA